MNKPLLIEKLDKLLWLGLISFAATMIFSIAIVQMIVGVLAILWLFRIIITPGYKFIRTPIDYPFVAFIAARVLSVIFSIDYSVSLPTLYKEIPFYIIYFIVTQSIKWDEKKVSKLVIVLIISACVASIIGVSKVLMGIELRANSTTSGYSTLGMFLTVILSLSLALSKNKLIFKQRWLWWGSLFVMGMGLLLTFNRTHWGVAAIIFLIIGLYRERIALMVSLICGVIAIIAIPSIAERFNQLVHFLQYTSGRDVIWQGAFQLIFEKPLTGFGPRTFEMIFPLFNQLEDKLIGSWHCDYLQVYMESGLPGIISYLWLIGVIYYVGLKILKNKFGEVLQKDLSLGIILGMSAFFLTGIVGGFIIDPITSLLFRFLLGLLAIIVINQMPRSNQS
jgi:O-antigen ligase